MKIAIVGSRDYPDLEAVRQYVQSLPLDTVVVSGGASGVDITAEKAAKARGMQTEVYYPDWKQYGKSAGFLRNRLIIEAADKVVAFHVNNSRGTGHSIALAKRYGKELEVIKP